MNQIVCSSSKYIREEALSLIQKKKWYLASSSEVQDKINSISEEFNGFLNDLADRADENNFYRIIKLVDLYWDERYALPTFDVESVKDGSKYANSYIAWRKGVFHSVRGLILVRVDNKISHFLVRKSVRFASGSEVIETIGSIYPPTEFNDDSPQYKAYLEEEVRKITRIPSLKFSKFIDLGQVYPDVGMSDNIAKLFTAIVDVKDIQMIDGFIKDKQYNDKRYDYSFELVEVSGLLNFLAKTHDSFLLAIFGRLQALNVIKL